MKKELSRRNGARIAAELMKLLGGRLSAVMLLAVLNGSLGFLCAMGVPFFGAVGIAKALGESIPLSYGAIAGLCVGCGVLRGGLRYLEQYGNHYIAFRLLAVLRDKIFTKLRALCPAKLESRQKGSLLTMITADIETLEVFYAHTVSPVCIAVLVSAVVMVVSVPDRGGGLSVHRRSAAPVFLPPHGRDWYAVQAGAWGLWRVFS